MSDYIPKRSIFDPNEKGEFGGIFGGQYVPETLMPVLKELEIAYSKYRFDKDLKNISHLKKGKYISVI